MNRKEHINWSKERALKYLESGDTKNALASMLSDLGKHKETMDHSAIMLEGMLMMAGHLNTVPEVKKFIEGFN